ncbi:SLAM family member 9-like isoform X2 [Engystomops pustulosus]|uniref:SLAM family member 9-like isoform X2 n=1 Tax=Engystomops pustulosus TaxID=76066 RepID=UPI003AFB7A89
MSMLVIGRRIHLSVMTPLPVLNTPPNGQHLTEGKPWPHVQFSHSEIEQGKPILQYQETCGYPQLCVVSGDSCGQQNVSGAKGGEIILRVPNVKIRKINWVLVQIGDLIVTTEPGGSIDDIDVMTQYRGRVSSDADGSLHIYKLSLQDRGSYKANIKRTSGDDKCVVFNLTVYEPLSPGDIRISPTITRNGSCSLELLCSVDKPDVLITWRKLHGGAINVTQGILYVPPSDVNFTYMCNARNPVSNVSKTVIPEEYCKTDKENTSPMVAGIRIHAIAAVIVIIFLLGIVCVVLRKQCKGKPPKEEITTEYAQVGGLQCQQENHYGLTQEQQQASTVYSEVQHAKESQQNGNGAPTARPRTQCNGTNAKSS